MTDFATPTVVDDVLLAFPGNIRHLMPDYDHCGPTDMLTLWAKTAEAEPYLAFQREWFFFGLPDANIYLKPGIDGKVAFRHLACIQRSFEPKHEHKEMAVAWLLSQWCTEPPLIRKKKKK